jgi:hypothetical protein
VSPAAAAAAAPAQAEDPREACVRAHEAAQVARLEGRFTDARAELRECSRDLCPAVLQRDCVGWADELQRETPTVVVQVLTDAGDTTAGRLFSGDVLLAERLDGRPVALDPGPRALRVELADGQTRTVSVVLRQGEKNRLVRVDFRAPEPAAPGPAAPVAEPAPRLVRPVRPLTWVLVGTAAVATGLGVGFGADALAKQSAAEEECAPLCPSERVDGIEAAAIASDVSWAVAGAAAVGAVVSYVLRPTVEATARRAPPGAPGVATLRLSPAGAGLVLSGQFP